MSTNYPLGILVGDAAREVLGKSITEEFPQLEAWSLGRAVMNPNRVVVRWKLVDGLTGTWVIENVGDDPLPAEDMRILVASVLALFREGIYGEH